MKSLSFTLKKIVFIVACYVYRSFFGRAIYTPKTLNRVMVIHMGKLGDMVCTTPVFHAIKKYHPECEVHVMGNRINKEVVAGNPDVNTYVVFESIYQAQSVLAQGEYDAVVLAGAPDISSLAVSLLTRVRCIIAPAVNPGVTPLADVWYRLLIRLVIGVHHAEGTYAPGAYLNLLNELGIRSTDTKKHLYVSPAALSQAAEYMSRSKGSIRVGMAPAAGNKIKEWPPERFAELAEYLIRTYDADIFVFGTKADWAEIEAMYTVCTSSDRIHNTVGSFSIDQLKAMISKLDIFIAADTGSIYIAEAFNIPTVDIVGPVDERVQPPQSVRHRIVVPPGRTRPQISVLNSKWYDYSEAKSQSESTPVALVIKETDSLLAHLGFKASIHTQP